MKAEKAKAFRCAIYTRVSSDLGLEQEFNSLDNQREASEAYVKSQAHEGWTCLPDLYDDGGFSGGSLERPGLQRILEDIRAKKIDIVVVYKVDRLTRSLADFAKLVELFDANGVSFVSVTQAFNTTNSMGRLTLNVLLSFAQFEREVTAERIRDKIAASKRKGIRMGGPVPFGYGLENKRLIVNPEEADSVRTIFRRYLELGCLTKLLRDLEARGIVTKLSQLGSGKTRGGIPFTKGPLHYLLRNRVYVGDLVHKEQHFRGEHQPIIDRELFDAVQVTLTSKANTREHARINNQSILVGRIFDDRGNRMTPSTAKKGGARYRYYVSAPLNQGRREDVGSVPRVPAPEIETLVVNALQQRASALNEERPESMSGADAVREFVEKIVVQRGAVELELKGEGNSPLTLPWAPPPPTRRRDVIPVGGQLDVDEPIRSETRARLLEGIARGRSWLDELLLGQMTDTKQIAVREGCSDRSVRMTLSLAFLNPKLVTAAVEGRLPGSAGSATFFDASPQWSDQNRCRLRR